MIKLFSLIFSTFGLNGFYPAYAMMPSDHLPKTNYVFPHEWLVCTSFPLTRLMAVYRPDHLRSQRNHNALALTF